MKQKKRTCRGFTLIETIMALLVLAIGIGGVFSLLLIARESGHRSRDHYTAINIGKNRLELCNTFDYKDLPFMRETNVLVAADGSANLQGNFRRTTLVSNQSSTLTEVSVRVDIRNRKTWQFDGINETISSLYTQY